MQPLSDNATGAIWGAIATAAVAVIGWFSKPFVLHALRIFVGSEGSGERRVSPQRFGALEGAVTQLSTDIAEVRGDLGEIDKKFDQVRKEREDGERRLIGALNDHSTASSETLGEIREDIGSLFGLLGHARPRRAKPPRPRGR